MPGLDGIGPFRPGHMAGWGFRKRQCFTPEGPVQSGEKEETPEQITPKAPLYGAGCGGIPSGCRRGLVFSGGRRCRWG